MEPNMPTGETMNEGDYATPSDGKMKSPEPKSNGMEVPIPLEALASPGEDDQMMSPTVGDPVSLYAEGKIVRIDGQRAIVAVDNINGKPLDAKTANTPEADENGDKSDEAEFEQLKSMAAMQPPR